MHIESYYHLRLQESVINRMSNIIIIQNNDRQINLNDKFQNVINLLIALYNRKCKWISDRCSQKYRLNCFDKNNSNTDMNCWPKDVMTYMQKMFSYYSRLDYLQLKMARNLVTTSMIFQYEPQPRYSLLCMSATPFIKYTRYDLAGLSRLLNFINYRPPTPAELVVHYSILNNFIILTNKHIRINRLKHKRWIHGELLCRPPKGNFLGGQDYHKMVDYFMKL